MKSHPSKQDEKTMKEEIEKVRRKLLDGFCAPPGSGECSCRKFMADPKDCVLEEHMAVIDAHRAKRLERRLAQTPTEFDRRQKTVE